MKQAGLLGHPLGHTLSPLLHEKLCRYMGEAIEYRKLDIPLENLDASMPELKSLDGFNVTIPHKRNIQTYLDELDASAQRHGAVNVVLRKEGRWIGYNTDCIGFVRCVEGAGIPLQGEVCVVGLGGAGRMFATECASRACHLTVALRKQHIEELERGENDDLQQLLQHLEDLSAFPVRCVASENLSGNFDLLINGSPIGMYPNVDAMPVPEQVLSGVKAVFDCIYNPKETLLMKAARQAGCHVCGGMAMLVWQAAAAQEIWYGKQFQAEQVEQVLLEMEAVL